MDDATFKYPRGAWAKDVVTGFEGWIVGRFDYITGCNTYELMPVSKDGAKAEGVWVDENRLKVTHKKALKLPERRSRELSRAIRHASYRYIPRRCTRSEFPGDACQSSGR